MDLQSDQRLAGLTAWANQQLSTLQLYQGPSLPLQSVSGDASFRRYFRCRFEGKTALNTGLQSLICVDAPPDKENNPAFIRVARGFAAAGVPVPQLLAVDLEQGYMLLSDLGDCLLKTVLNPQTVEQYFGIALRELTHIMQADFSADPLPHYDCALLQREMELFREWFCDRFLQLDLSQSEHELLTEVFAWLQQQALAQQQVPVHRDYHTRNLMVLEDGRLGVIDFQDAVLGPVTYDLLSLLRDETFPTWDQAQVKCWVAGFAAQLRQADLCSVDDERFWWDFNGIGAQRHLKVAGIFARLKYRDHKQGYLEHTPQSLQYILMEINELKARAPDCIGRFYDWLLARVVPPLLVKFPNSDALFTPTALAPVP